jgi:hypothetical protein
LRDSQGKVARCSIAAPTAAPRYAARTKARRAFSPVRITAGAILNTGKLRAVPWPDGYACDFKDSKFNVAQVPRVDSYRGFIFATLNPDAPSLLDISAPSPSRSMNGWTASPRARSRCARRTGSNTGQLEARLRQFRRRLSRRVLSPLAAGDGEPPGRRRQQGHVVLQGLAGHGADVHGLYEQAGTTSRTNARTSRSAPADCGPWKACPRHRALRRGTAPTLRRQGGEILDLASSEPVNINVFPNFSLLGNHIQVFEPVSVDETNVTWYARRWSTRTALDGAVDEINACGCAPRAIPEFRRSRRPREFRRVLSARLACLEDEWVYMHRGLDIPGRVKTDANGIIPRLPPTKRSCGNISRNGSG